MGTRGRTGLSGKAFLRKVPCEQRAEGGEGVSHVAFVLGRTSVSRGNSRHRGSITGEYLASSKSSEDGVAGKHQNED